MILLKVIVNGEDRFYKSTETQVHKAITNVRELIKKEFKKKENYNLWFVNIKI